MSARRERSPVRRSIALISGALAGAFILASASARADEYHYRDVLVGERAAGMGGAFIAVSDDPSGIYYNPAGIVFSLENYFSLSANAYSSSSQVFKDIFPGQDYTYTSAALVPAFFGFTQSYGKHKFGFAVVVPYSELIDQDDTISDANATAVGQANTLKRRFFRQNITYYAGPAYAHEIAHNLTFGVTLFGFYRSDRWIDNQLIYYNPVGTGKYFIENSFQSRSSYGITPKIGFQWMPSPKLAFGLTASTLFNLGGSGTLQVLTNNTDSNNVPVPYNGTFNNDATIGRSDNVFHDQSTAINVGTGAAYFFSKTTLLSAELDVYGPDPHFLDFPVATTYNWSIGGEQYLSDAWALRAGVFTNRARTPQLSSSAANQPPHVDMLGATAGVSFFKPGSSLTLSTAYSSGSGQGQAIGGTTATQVVDQSNLTFFLTGSYQL
jgi:long-chain fatty acid transport protein